MEFTIENWNEATRNIIANASDQGQLTALMTQASEQVSGLFVSFQEADKERVQLKEENERLKAFNMDLFMRISEQNREKVNPDGKKAETKDRAETITTADLFKKEE